MHVRRVTPRIVKLVKEMASSGCFTKEIVRVTGLSESTIFKIRQGCYDEARLRREFPDDYAGDDGAETALSSQARSAITDASSSDDDEPPPPLVVWCRQCRCHVYPPCQLCRAREHRKKITQARARRRATTPAEESDPNTTARLRMSVAELGLPTRTSNYLQHSGIETVNDLLHCTRRELARIPNFGGKTIEQILRSVRRLGFGAMARPRNPRRIDFFETR